MAKEPKRAEIEETLNKAREKTDEGGSNWPGMSYEEGVAAALDWVLGNVEQDPMEDE